VIGSSDDVKPEHLLLRSQEPRFVENYLPVRANAGGPVIGVVEVYRVPVALFETIAHGLRLIWGAFQQTANRCRVAERCLGNIPHRSGHMPHTWAFALGTPFDASGARDSVPAR
jgi:hypothetical protein